MKRRAVRATTGPRIGVRYFEGYDFEPADAALRDPAVLGFL